MEVAAQMCATCPFRPGSRYVDLADYLTASSMETARICHSTGSNAINKRTGKAPKICRGSRDIQLKLMFALGVIAAPTDEAWANAWEKMHKRK